jgi:hypothetical protein
MFKRGEGKEESSNNVNATQRISDEVQRGKNTSPIIFPQIENRNNTAIVHIILSYGCKT